MARDPLVAAAVPGGSAERLLRISQPHRDPGDAYGGAGRDILIGNTGGDRLIDWAGEFNSYLVPFAPFGGFVISRSPAPHIME